MILLRYFLLLFLCLVFPVVGVSSWYGRQIRDNVRTELIRQNETSLQQVYNTVDAVLRSVKNTAYSISVNENVQYVATINAMGSDSASSLRSVMNMLSITQSSAEYIDSAYIYLDATAEIITKTGATTNPQLFRRCRDPPNLSERFTAPDTDNPKNSGKSVSVSVDISAPDPAESEQDERRHGRPEC